jgi:hypothetical protein
MFCPKCGTQQPLGRTCIKCNAPLSSTKIDFSSQTPLEQQTNENFKQPTQTNNFAPNPNLPEQEQKVPKKETYNYLPNLNQPAPPPWNYQTTEQERIKMVYPSVEMPNPEKIYSPGQYLQPFASNYLQNNPYQPQNNAASKRAVWALVFSILSFVFCPVLAAIIGVTLGYQELEAIEKGLAPPAGKPIAQIGYYLGMVNMVLYALGIGLIFLLTLL